MERKLLSPEEVTAALAGLDGWRAEDGSLKRRFEFANFADALAQVNRIGAIAEELDRTLWLVRVRIRHLCDRGLLIDPDGIPPLAKRNITRRPCMCCGKKFDSKGPHNRLCGDCRVKSVSPYAPS